MFEFKLDASIIAVFDPNSDNNAQNINQSDLTFIRQKFWLQIYLV